MALGNSIENSINSPWMMWSLIRGGTGGIDVRVFVGCTGIGGSNDWTVVVGCTKVGGNNDWTVVVGCTHTGAVENSICSEAAGSISSASAGLLAGTSLIMVMAERVPLLC